MVWLFEGVPADEGVRPTAGSALAAAWQLLARPSLYGCISVMGACDLHAPLMRTLFP